MNDFGAQSHGVWPRCLRFAGEVTRPPRKTRFRLLARLCRAGLVTRRVSTKGFTLVAIPLSRASWRNAGSALRLLAVLDRNTLCPTLLSWANWAYPGH